MCWCCLARRRLNCLSGKDRVWRIRESNTKTTTELNMAREAEEEEEKIFIYVECVCVRVMMRCLENNCKLLEVPLPMWRNV